MRNVFLILAVIFIKTTSCNAQIIESKKVFGGYQYTLNGETMNFKELSVAMEAVPDAQVLLKKARTKNSISSILGSIGGGLIGYQIGQSIAGGEANWTLAGIGAGIIGVAIPISSSANKSAQRAVEVYNTFSEPLAYSSFKPQFNIVSNSNGIGLLVTF